MQFLMELNECYEGIRKQILILNPIPTVSQAYGMVLQVEEQMSVSMQFAENVEQSALYTNNQKVGYKKRLTKEEKAKLRCDRCRGNGHIKADCFELIGVPEWYQKFKAEKGKGRAHFVMEKNDIPKVENDNNQLRMKKVDTDIDMSKMIQSEIAMHMAIYFQKGIKTDGEPSVSNLAEVELGSTSLDFSGHYAFGVAVSIKKNVWIIDSGANTHM
ncbi:hypothetical protein C2S52_003654 [Perilla frutescens var. hirtella]|nr:hypothetical protein C2S52_003654 [Perilla frutescens var. hirtella]